MSKRILLIDADEEGREAAREALTENGFGPSNGFELVEESFPAAGYALLQRDPSIVGVVTAWKNPNPKTGRYPAFNGVSLVGELRKHTNTRLQHLPVVVFTNDYRACRELDDDPSVAVVPKLEHSRLPSALRMLIERAA